MSDTDDTFELTDFRMAGFLLAHAVPFKGTRQNDKHDIVFIFANVSGTSSTADVLNKYPGSQEQRYDAACRTMHDYVKREGSLRFRRR